MLKLTCHCGALRLDVARRPDYINECNCTLCAKSGARWGYFEPAQVAVEGHPSTYTRADAAEPVAQLHFCGRCGATTHFTLTLAAQARFGQGQTGVNMRLLPDAALAGIEVRYPDGLAWNGAGAFAYVRESTIIGAGVPS